MVKKARPDVALLGGPYRAPRCKPGRPLDCRIRGELLVSGLTDAPVPWPYHAGPAGWPQLLVCGDLVKAIEGESALAVAHHWGVSRATVTRWRAALGVGRATAGTRALERRLWARRLGPEGSRKGGRATKGVPKPRPGGP
jgi:hypothetical protein